MSAVTRVRAMSMGYVNSIMVTPDKDPATFTAYHTQDVEQYLYTGYILVLNVVLFLMLHVDQQRTRQIAKNTFERIHRKII
jgi:hypothetical protein